MKSFKKMEIRHLRVDILMIHCPTSSGVGWILGHGWESYHYNYVSPFLDADTVYCGASNCEPFHLCSLTRYVLSLPHILYYICSAKDLLSNELRVLGICTQEKVNRLLFY